MLQFNETASRNEPGLETKAHLHLILMQGLGTHFQQFTGVPL